MINRKIDKKREENEKIMIANRYKEAFGDSKEVIEKEIIKEIPVEVEKEVIKEIEVIKEVDNPKTLEKIKGLEATVKEDNKTIADLKKKLEESKKAIAKFENLKKLLDSAQ